MATASPLACNTGSPLGSPSAPAASAWRRCTVGTGCSGGTGMARASTSSPHHVPPARSYERGARRRGRVTRPCSREAVHDKRVAPEQRHRARGDRVRLMALQPAPLGGDVGDVRCRPDHLAPAIAEPGNQLIVLDDRPAVAVQDRRSQRAALGVEADEVLHLPGDGERVERRGILLPGELPDRGDGAVPPVVGVLFDPAGMRGCQGVGVVDGGDDRAVEDRPPP